MKGVICMVLDVAKLRELMVHQGYTVTGLAKTAGVSSVSINQWLNHGKQPRMDTLGRILKALNAPLCDLVKEW